MAVASANNEIGTGRLQAFAENLPYLHIKNDADMRRRFSMTIDEARRRLA